MLFLLLLVLAILLALWLHHLFEGERLLHDLRREAKLARAPLEILDHLNAARTRRSDIIVSLTTTPSRIALLAPTLKSLLDQSLPAARIVLNIPHHSTREGRGYDIPAWLTALRAVEIHRCADLGPATKLIPTLERVPADQPVLALDDDRIYPHGLIAQYAKAQTEQPDAALTMAGWIVPQDLTDRPTTVLSNLLMRPPAPIRAPRLSRAVEIDVMLGVMSYLVRPRFFDLAELAQLDHEPEGLRYVDDVRTSALCEVPKRVIPAPSLSFVPWRQRRALQATRLGLRNQGGGGERPNTLAIRHYAERWRVGGAGKTPPSPFTLRSLLPRRGR